MSDSPTPESTFRVDGPTGPIEVVAQGTGPAIVVIHGGSGDLTSWAAVATLLAERRRVIRYTRPTYRLDPPPRGADAVEAEVGDALAVVRWTALQQDGAPVLVVGHSSGAVVALEAALTDAGPFRALALYEPPLDVTHTTDGADALGRARSALDGGDPVQAMRIHLTELVGMPAAAVATWLDAPQARAVFSGFAPGQIADNEMLHALPVGPTRFGAITLPVLLITGENSPEHLHERSNGLAAALPRSPERAELSDQGHGANHEDPAQLAAVIAAFADARD